MFPESKSGVEYFSCELHLGMFMTTDDVPYGPWKEDWVLQESKLILNEDRREGADNNLKVFLLLELSNFRSERVTEPVTM